ncbi:MAG: hypothetical protein JNK61_07850 [Bacteroidia bacterium]|nr:hypothetical protein [Bacteroidia bacterium]HQV00231.1 hypothetical protein [Bacteroidia bacterium]
MLLQIACETEKDKNGACDAGSESVEHVLLTNINDSIKPFSFPVVNGKTIFYKYFNGKVTFFIAYNKVNICTIEHLNVTYIVSPSDSAQTLPMKIYGEAYWSAYSDDLVLVSGPIQPSPQVYTGVLELGLQQAFGDGPGDVDFYVAVEFDTQGSFEADSLYFKHHIDLMAIEFKSDNYL